MNAGIKQKKLIAIIALALSAVIVAVLVITMVSNKREKESIVIMTEDVNGLFNPFYATSGADHNVVGMTQIGMLTTDRDGQPVAGDDQPTAVKAFEQKQVGGDTVYTFVLKNGLKYSDGKPLTMNDVFFNLYQYLDPVYTGSSTMYSTRIKGLSRYRTQRSEENVEQEIINNATALARMRVLEIYFLYLEKGEVGSSSYSLTEDAMRHAIAEYEVTDGYKDAVATDKDQETMTADDYREILLGDYDFILETFREELEMDFRAAREAFDTQTEPYKDHAELLKSDIFKFFLYEGYITPEYEKIQGKDNKAKIIKFDNTEIVNHFTTEEAAINRVYNDKVRSEFHRIVTQWGTANIVSTQFGADARSIILHNNAKEDGSLLFPNIEGIVSLGHTGTLSQITVDGTEYKIAKTHSTDGTPAKADEYDVLQITLDGVDPKAIYNFGFSVAPAHYYTADSENPNGRIINIANNQFGVEYASSSFQSRVIQSQAHVEVPVGAGAFMATDESNSDKPAGTGFFRSNIVYFKANPHFMFEVKADKLRMQVVSATNAMDGLKNGALDFITPQFTKANSETLTSLKSKGIVSLDAWQLGYGYIGVNAGKVPNINIRRAIMAAMQTSLALEYYQADTCKNIDWPMSTENWAYPFEADGITVKPNGVDYLQWRSVAGAKETIQKYMNLAGVTAGSADLTIKFTIAGASVTEHPTFAVFQQAAEILNDMDWDVEVKADSQALVKLSTGSLAVWAAAWGSTIDPDMYQVYHKNSTATSVYSWGYREIKSNTSLYAEENRIINQLSEVIDDAREILDRDRRTELYEEAMRYVLELAVEMPVYQRKTLYAYNSKTITGLSSEVNPYTSPLERIWELELVK